jgi:hypothetical protein
MGILSSVAMVCLASQEEKGGPVHIMVGFPAPYIRIKEAKYTPFPKNWMRIRIV